MDLQIGQQPLLLIAAKRVMVKKFGLVCGVDCRNVSNAVRDTDLKMGQWPLFLVAAASVQVSNSNWVFGLKKCIKRCSSHGFATIVVKKG